MADSFAVQCKTCGRPSMADLFGAEGVAQWWCPDCGTCYVWEQVTRQSVVDAWHVPSRLAALTRVFELVKYALSQKGDEVCWRDLYNAEVASLVGVDFDPELPPREQFVGRNCPHFYDCLAEGKPYQTPG